MEEKESHLKNRSLLKEAYEQTGNTWSYVFVNDLYVALLIKLEGTARERHNWTRSESVNAKRQLEVFHLLSLLDVVEENNLKKFAIELQMEMPNINNSIQPLYNPNIEEENQPVLSIQRDSGDLFILKENEFLLKSSTEI